MKLLKAATVVACGCVSSSVSVADAESQSALFFLWLILHVSGFKKDGK